ncbi:DUF6933 domain-containing protein [Nitrospira sp. Kam-Ns4a]
MWCAARASGRSFRSSSARNESFPAAFGPTLAAVLERLGVRADLVGREVAAVREVAFAKPVSRQVLGAMNDFAGSSPRLQFDYVRRR